MRALRSVSHGVPWALVPLVAMVASIAHAAETGDLRGKVEDRDGLPVPNARVTLSGPRIGGEMTAETDADGRFQILQIPPGQHVLQVEMGGFQGTQITVTVRLDESAFVPVTLSPAGSTLEVVVETTLPVIDATHSSLNTELNAQQLQNLPTGRSYQDAINMIPGVSGRVDTQDGGSGSGNPSVRGEGAYGNNFFIDGISTRDPATKTFGANVQFDAIDSIQVYTDGAPAEFGQFTGMLVNVDTKDGGDEFFGTAAYYLSLPLTAGEYDILDIDTGKEVPTKKADFLNHELAATFGGPIVKEKLWYFGTLDMIYADSQREGVDVPTTTTQPQGFLKFTWFATPDLTFAYQASGDYSASINENADALILEGAYSKRNDWGMTHILTTRFRPDAKGELEFKLATTMSVIDVVPMSGDEETPQIQNVDTGAYYNNHSDFDFNQRSRTGGSLKLTRLADGFLGSHKVKVGTEVFYLAESRELTRTGPGDGVQYWASPDNGYPCSAADFSDCFGYTEYQETPPIGHSGITTGSFVQDDWAPVPTLTFNVGARVDTETLFNTDGDFVIQNIMPAPRIGVAWDATGDSKTLLLANYGWYYDIAGNDFAAWADSRSADYFSQYQVDPNTGGYVNTFTQDPVLQPLVYCTEDSLNDYIDGLTAAGNDPGFVKDQRKVAEDLCGNGLKPYHSEKLVLGVEREIFPLLAVGLRGIYSYTKNIPEDIDINLDTWVIANVPQKRRDYKAIELTLERKPNEVWSALASYTLSASRGTTPGQFELSSGGSSGSNGNEVGVYLDDINDLDTRAFFYDNGLAFLPDGLAGLGTVYDDAGYYGYLPYHQFHQAKINGFYTLPFGTTLGLIYEYGSGNAWQKRGYIPLYGDYLGLPEGRGSRFMPATHFVDMRVAHKVSFPNDRSIELSIDMFNVPDLQTPIGYYENDNESFGAVLFRQAPRSMRAAVKGAF